MQDLNWLKKEQISSFNNSFIAECLESVWSLILTHLTSNNKDELYYYKKGTTWERKKTNEIVLCLIYSKSFQTKQSN